MQTHDTVELAFVVLAALALLTQTVILLAMYLGINKATQSLKEEIDELRTSVMPTVHNTRELVERLGPKVEQTVTDVAALAKGLRLQAEEFESVAGEVLARVRTETGRVDHMFSNALDAVDKASQFVTHAVSKPVRQVSGVLASLRAIVESLRTPAPHYGGPAYRDDPAYHDDKDMFV